MVEESESELSREQSKSVGPGRWRDKLLKATKRPKGQTASIDENVSDFLRGSSFESKPTPKPSLDTSVAARWPSASELSTLALGPSTAEQAVSVTKKKKRDTRGLHVNFSNAAPDIIGEGGDESELPTKDVIGSWTPPKAGTESSTNYTPTGRGNDQPPASLTPGTGLSSQVPGQTREHAAEKEAIFPSLQRTPTGRPLEAFGNHRRSQQAEEAYFQSNKNDTAFPATGETVPREAAGLTDAKPQIPQIPPSRGYSSTKSYTTYSNNSDTSLSFNLSRQPTIPDLSVEPQPQGLAIHGIGELRLSPSTVDSSSSASPQNFSRLQAQPKIPILPSKIIPKISSTAAYSDAKQYTALNSGGRTPSPYKSSHSQSQPTIPILSLPLAVEEAQRFNPFDDPPPHEELSVMQPLAGKASKTENGPPNYISSHTQQYSDAQIRSEEPEPYISQQASRVDEHSFEEFYTRIEHLHNVFRLGAQVSDHAAPKHLAQWLRACIWWFLKGRTELETSTRGKQADLQRAQIDEGSHVSHELNKSYVDLAKAWWIMKEIVPEQIDQAGPSDGNQMSDVADGLSHSQMIQVYKITLANMQALAFSMKKNNLLPPQSLLIQGMDTSIWIEYPPLDHGVLCLVAQLNPQTLVRRTLPGQQPFFGILLADTNRHFSYGRMFVEVEVVADGEPDEVQLPCILSIMRERTGSVVEITIVSQDGQVNLHIQPDRKKGLTWNDVEWKIRSHSIRIHLASDFEVVVRLWAPDFKTLWGIHDYNQRVEKDWQMRDGEALLFDDVVPVFQFIGPADSPATFPVKPVKRCKVRLFEQRTILADGRGQRKLHEGTRLVVNTPPSNKTLSNVSRVFGRGVPIVFSHLRGEDNAPALLLNVKEEGKKSSMILTFPDIKKRTELHSLMNGAFVAIDESMSKDITLQDLSIKELSAEDLPKREIPTPRLHWQHVSVINQGHDQDVAHTVSSDHLRVCITCNLGVFVDRINLGPGELQLSLEIEDTTAMNLFRPAQKDLTISCAEHLLSPDDPRILSQILTSIAAGSTVRRFKFGNLPDLHRFQTFITGFSVLYDGLATNFSISRRRMVVPIYKRMEASLARMQILQRETVVQLTVFMEDFSLGRSMNFVLKGTDELESFARSGKFYIRFVDAKFAMPKSQKELGGEFVCLDTPEYPGEHDDIVIGFDSEEERDTFGAALPASVSKVSRMTSFRK